MILRGVRHEDPDIDERGIALGAAPAKKSTKKAAKQGKKAKKVAVTG
jgi:hypothetical protein